MTKAIIGGLTYNTETAIEIGRIGSDGNTSCTDFRYYSGTLYRTKKGRYFVDGHGGAMSIFAQSYGQNGSIGGEGIIALESDCALAMAEREGMDADTIAEHFADMIEDA